MTPEQTLPFVTTELILVREIRNRHGCTGQPGNAAYGKSSSKKSRITWTGRLPYIVWNIASVV
jgi:hypothetical protein